MRKSDERQCCCLPLAASERQKLELPVLPKDSTQPAVSNPSAKRAWILGRVPNRAIQTKGRQGRVLGDIAVGASTTAGAAIAIAVGVRDGSPLRRSRDRYD